MYEFEERLVAFWIKRGKTIIDVVKRLMKKSQKIANEWQHLLEGDTVSEEDLKVMIGEFINSAKVGEVQIFMKE